MHRARTLVLLSAACSAGAHAVEVVVKNDSLTDFGNAVIVQGFNPSERAGAWLTSPCTGNLRAVQVFWRSPSGGTGQTIHNGIEIYRAATFPEPGMLAEQIIGPVLTDGVLNEFRYLDDNMAIPLIVPVTANETVVVALNFTSVVTAASASVVRDTDGNQSGRNTIYAELTPGNFVWLNSSSLGVLGDWVIRAVVDCAAVPTQADLGVSIQTSPAQYTAGQSLGYTIVIGNAGPAASASNSIVDIFPAAYQNPSWTCSASAGASCPASGLGNIAHNVGLPVAGQVTFTVTGTVAPGTTGTLSNNVTAVVGGGLSDPVPANNTATANTQPANTEIVFVDGFET
jgi:uncharacterized repeat protein (TIGR01451 family)